MEPQPTPVQQSPQVSFPQPREPEGKSNSIKWIIAIVGVLLIVGAGGWFILGNNSGEGAANASPTPGGGLSTFPTPSVTEAPTDAPTATPAPVDKSEIKIEVLNGTGTPGDAGFLQGELEDLGFEDVTAGNADDQDQTETVATYSRELSATVADEITEKLEELYTTVRTRRATISGGFDVSITTGTKKSSGTSASPKASATASPKASATATPKTSASATPTPTATAN